MKRVKTLTAGNSDLSVSIKITMTSNSYLTRQELDRDLTKLADEAMIALSNVSRSDFYLSKVKVK